MFLKKMKNHEGFTLVELIVVIAIMAILAGVAVPAYSGYIEKANKAADYVLLDAVNTAFAAAVMEDDHKSTIELPDGYASFNTSALTVSKHNDTFQTYFDGNGGTFKSINLVTFRGGLFVEASETMQGLLNTLLSSNGTDITTLNGSSFAAMGAAGLMEEVDFVTDLAAEMLKTSPNGKFADIIKSQEYGAALAAVMGYDVSTLEGQTAFVSAMETLTTEKMNQLQTQDPEKYAGMDPTDKTSDLYKDAQNAIYANNAVLYAAQNSASASSSILTTLGGANASGTITAALSGTNSKDGLAQAAMAYGLYTAYASKNNIEVSSNPAEVLSALDSDTGFKNYINNVDGSGQAQKDLDGYLSAMNMINTSTSNKEAVSDVLVNGFADPNLVALLQSAMSSGATK